MKIYLIILVGILSSCTHYTTTPMSKKSVIVSRTTNILGLYGGTIFTCRKDDNGIIIDCKENTISVDQVKTDSLKN